MQTKKTGKTTVSYKQDQETFSKYGSHSSHKQESILNFNDEKIQLVGALCAMSNKLKDNLSDASIDAFNNARGFVTMIDYFCQKNKYPHN